MGEDALMGVSASRRAIEADNAPTAQGGYAQAIEISGASRILYISGQIPVAPDGSVPGDFGSQCRLVWANLEAQLVAADMTLDHIVKITTFLSDRGHADEGRRIRNEILGNRKIALTAIITGIFDPEWLIEIEAVAMA